ncbi:MAG: hypothetical protein HYX26_08970 [Acidobacteriales bacterium]|nr:hypothetical protein [Terriglobales bacterium]
MAPENHAVREFFQVLVEKHFHETLGLRDQELSDYVSNLIGDFCEAEELFKIRDGEGRPLTDVGEMLLAADPVYGPAPSFDRERQVRKHIGDFTLFFTGMFPESVNARRLRRHRLESFVDFIKAGKESYYIVSKFEHFEYAKVAPLFARLSNEFERCVYGLNIIKNELEVMQHPIARRANELIM